jgi:DNA-binding FadR family transcriptional regulator
MAGEAGIRHGLAETAAAEQNGDAPAFVLPRRSSRAESVAAAVETQIASRALVPGTRLGTRRDLGEQLGVAPSTISEAIKLLEDRGRVSTRTGPRGGVFVAEPSLTLRLARSMMQVSGARGEVADALAVRDVLEPAVIEAAAAAGHNRAELTELRRAMRAMRSARDTADFYRRNLEFHAEIAALCRNDVLRTIYEGLLNAVRAREPRLELLPGQNWRALHAARVRVHQAITDAITAGDVVAARVAAAAHKTSGPAEDSPAR